MKYLLFFALILFACTSKNETASDNTTGMKADTTDIIREFIYGLWSMDTGNALSNEGFNFRNDGMVDFISAEYTGRWELKGTDTLKIVHEEFNEASSEEYKIESIMNGRMYLTGKDGRRLFRKVPFGMNAEGTVLQGFSGSIASKGVKDFYFTVSSAKKMELRLNSENEKLEFNIYDGENLITPVPVRNWAAIMIRSGKYKVQLLNRSSLGGEYDLKVIGY